MCIGKSFRAAAGLSLLLLCAPAHALLFRAYVSSTGNDANPCTLAAPCRLLPAALAAVASGGEVWMLDSANYNSATLVINDSVSILAVPGAVGSIVAAAGPAVSVPAADKTINLRNLVIVPLPGAGGTDGVSITGTSRVSIEGSVVAGHAEAGVLVAGGGSLSIAGSTIRGNAGYGVWVQGPANASIASTNLTDNVLGGVIAFSDDGSSPAAVVSDCILTGGVNGVIAWSTSVGSPKVAVTRSSIQRTTYALRTFVAGTPLVTASYSTITNNANAWFVGSGVIRSYGNNQFSENGGASGSLTVATLQ